MVDMSPFVMYRNMGKADFLANWNVKFCTRSAASPPVLKYKQNNAETGRAVDPIVDVGGDLLGDRLLRVNVS